MWKRTISCAPAAALFTAAIFSVSAPEARAEPLLVTAPSDTAPTLAVSHADLDLASAAGRERLNHRIKAAVRALCGEQEIAPLSERGPKRRCATTALKSAEPQVAAAIRADTRSAQSTALARGSGR